MTGLRWRKRQALILCALFIAVFAVSLLFVIEHAGHSCSDVNCSICLQINACQNLLKQLGAEVAVVLCLFAVLALSRVSRAAAEIGFFFNPVLLKVKLSN